ncbi:acyl-CoA dehydrogenase [Nocardia sp. ET3-3]|uniref:Acyl-CoA dehydrogenase n=1 Tax=Nocardia terrae TaxID=2675851 RepID=A0A7K1V275_9NOCA|nr:acyl-CoA dehydrogenase family protein [Nocardia terrae]MVU80705.1 acyl-CoA dehydrogenase [Nocardia terrae]
MTISFGHSPEVLEIVRRTISFVEDVALPVEEFYAGSAHHLPEEMRLEIQSEAKVAGIFAPHVGVEYGGLGLGMCDRAPVFEAAGYSLFGPLALNCAAPDEGNMHLLEQVASDQQKEEFLGPLASGTSRSCFAMTEPAPGAGSDPTALLTRAERGDDGWVINGHKWFITGAHDADFAIVMARTSGEPGSRGGATMFLVPTDTVGFVHRRDIDTLDESMYGGHSELIFDNLEVPDNAVLGEVDKGFDYAQVRLGPARMTHCMRWLGTARRAADLAADRAATRKAFGGRLGDLGMIQHLIADNEIDIEAARALTLKACWDLDNGLPSAQSTSIAKTFVAEAVNRVVDRSLQICGALGVSGDIALSRLYREVRPFRIYDGPSETHRWAIARRVIRTIDKARQ